MVKLIEIFSKAKVKPLNLKLYFQKEDIEMDATFTNIKGVKFIMGIKDEMVNTEFQSSLAHFILKKQVKMSCNL